MAKLPSLADTAANPAPSVSVSEALGLPEDWSKSSIAEIAGKPIERTAPDEPAADEAAAAEGEEGAETPAAVEGEEPAAAEPTAEEKKAADEAAAAAAAKPAAKPKAEGGKPKPGAKPAVTPKPGAKPAVAAAGPKAGDAAPAAKVKVGDKEYTPEELQALIAKAQAPEGTVKPVAAADPAKKEPTAEEIAVQREDIRQKDEAFVTRIAPNIAATIDEETLDKIMAGGKAGAETLQNLLRVTAARAVLESRKTMYHDLQPVLNDLRGRLEPLTAAQEAQENQREWGSFAEAYPDLADHKELVENAAAVLLQTLGDKAKELTMPQFKEKTAEQVRIFLKRVGAAPKEEAAPAAGAAGAEGAEGAAKPAAGAKPVAGAKPAAAKPGAKPVPARAKVAPPAANVPSPTGGKDTKGKSGDGAIIASLW